MSVQKLVCFYFFATLSLAVVVPLRPPFISPTDDSHRIIPVVQQGANGSNDTVDALLCGTAPPSITLREMHKQMDNARTREKRGIGEHVERLGLEKRANPSAFIVETYFHLVTTNDQSRFFSPTTRTQIVNNQVRGQTFSFTRSVFLSPPPSPTTK